MLLFFDSERKIYAYNKVLSRKQQEEWCYKTGVIIYDGDFDFSMGEDVEGKEKEFYLNEDGTIRIEYVDVEPIPEPEPTEEEIAQAELLLMQTEILANQNAQDEVLAEILLNQMGV